MEKVYDEEKIREKLWKRWRRIKLVEKMREKGKEVFIIDTPPPYPTGGLHMGHLLDWSLTDAIARTRRMEGYKVIVPQGFDCHGLPTEVQVEKKYGISGAEAYRDPSLRKRFVELCRRLSENNIELLKEDFELLAYLYDPDWEYVTDTKEYMKLVQLSFLEHYKNGQVYRAEHPVTWCPRCCTAIAEAEIDYEEERAEIYYIKIKVEGGEEITIATTRPEMLPACVAVFANPEDERYAHLIGKKARIPLVEREVKIIGDERVDPAAWTGITYCCTFGDKTDLIWTKKYELPIIKLVDENGRITKAGGKYEGMKIEEARKAIVKDLEKIGALVKREEIEHKIGVCWRCGTPIEIVLTKQWFLKAMDYARELLEIAKEIEWIPPYLYQRLADWIKGLLWDWVISRQRVFGTPIPVWYCKKCGSVKLASEEELPVDPAIQSPSSPCECGSTQFEGERDVFDTWFDSSLTPLYLAGWPDLKKEVFPSSLRRQGNDIIKTWTFYTLLRTYLLTGEIPWKQAAMHGMVLGTDMKKMSKSRGNVVLPSDLLKDYPVDALRQWACSSTWGKDHPVDYKELKHARAFLIKLWNIARFCSPWLKKKLSSPLLTSDRWILSKLQRLIGEVRRDFKELKLNQALKKIRSFAWHEFADFYIEMCKRRIYKKDEAAGWVLYQVLLSLLKLLAPFIPYLSEEIYLNLFEAYEGKESVHLHDFPSPREEFIDEEIEKRGELLKELFAKVRELRREKKIGWMEEIEEVLLRGKVGELEGIEEELKTIAGIKKIKIEEAEQLEVR